MLELLQAAMDGGQRVSIVYNGGSFPGQARPIIPIQVEVETVRAREPGMPQDKTFKVAKIASVTLLDGTTATNAFASSVVITQSLIPTHSSMEGYVTYLRPQYESLGWHCYHHPEERSFGVAVPLKSGKPPKHPKIRILFMDRTIEEYLDPVSGEIVQRKRELTGRERPWRVESYLQPQAKAFADLHLAIEFFAGEVTNAKPSPLR